MIKYRLSLEEVRSRVKNISPNLEMPFLEDEYTNTDSIVTLFCPIHGSIKHSVSNIIYGKCGCKKCSLLKVNILKKRRLLDIPSLKEILHKYPPADLEGRYYSKESVPLICEEHGEFKILLKSLIRDGAICRKCYLLAEDRKKPLEDYLSEMSNLHKNEYAYSLPTPYIGAKTYVEATCNRHGPWTVTIYNHLHNSTKCPKCSNQVSVGGQDLADYVHVLCPDSIQEYQIKNTKADIFIPSKNIAIEYNGFFYHGSGVKTDVKGHFNRRELYESLGIRMITIWSDEWPNDKTKAYLNYVLGKSSPIYARKCSAPEVIPSEEARTFLEKTHLMGSGLKCPLYLGLRLGGELVACVGFRKGFHKKDELYRAAYKENFRVIGGLSRIVKYWKSINEDRPLISYVDLDKFQGGSYFKSGFVKVSTSVSLFYHKRDVRIPRHDVMKNKLKKWDNYDPSKTEKQILEEKFIFQCWNSGTLTLLL